MTIVLLFHQAQGQTPGFRAYNEQAARLLKERTLTFLRRVS